MDRLPEKLEPWEVDLWYSAIAVLERNFAGDWEDDRKQDAAMASIRGGERTTPNGQTRRQGAQEAL